MSDDQRILVPKDRVFSRAQGCWNCSNSRSAKEFWSDRRDQDLGKALKIATDSALGEEHPKVKNIRHMVDTVDHAVAAGALVRCTKGRTATGQPVGDLVANNYLCDRWSAKQGASIAREGGKIDDLPEELADKLDGTPSSNMDEVLEAKAKIDSDDSN